MCELIIKTPAFEHEGLIPIIYTGYGEDILPEIHLENINENAKTIAILMDDIGHPISNYNHWIIWNITIIENIPSNIPHGKIVENLNGAIQGRGYGKHRYRGPKPPFNWSHKYQFNVYTLDCIIDLPVSSKKKNLLKSMKGHILQYSYIIGHYR